MVLVEAATAVVAVRAVASVLVVGIVAVTPVLILGTDPVVVSAVVVFGEP